MREAIILILSIAMISFSGGALGAYMVASPEPEEPASLTLRPTFIIEVVEAQAEEVEESAEQVASKLPASDETEEPEEVKTEEEDFEDLGEFTLTAYCGCEKCCGQWANNGTVIGSGGVPLIQGVHCASPLRNGTEVLIEGYGIYEVQDSTADWIADKYNGKIIDIYFENHDDALAFGKRTANVKRIVK